DGEVAGHGEVVPRTRDPLAFEGNGWMVVDVEEVWRAEVFVSLRIAGDQRRDVDFGLDGRVLRVVGRVDNGAVHAGEATPHLREHHVPGAELGQAVAWVNVPD